MLCDEVTSIAGSNYEIWELKLESVKENGHSVFNQHHQQPEQSMAAVPPNAFHGNQRN